MALGLADDRKMFRTGRLTKDGEGGSIAWYFYQPARMQREERGDRS